MITHLNLTLQHMIRHTKKTLNALTHTHLSLQHNIFVPETHKAHFQPHAVMLTLKWCIKQTSDEHII